jgi:hypothetical protein
MPFWSIIVDPLRRSTFEPDKIFIDTNKHHAFLGIKYTELQTRRYEWGPKREGSDCGGMTWDVFVL